MADDRPGTVTWRSLSQHLHDPTSCVEKRMKGRSGSVAREGVRLGGEGCRHDELAPRRWSACEPVDAVMQPHEAARSDHSTHGRGAPTERKELCGGDDAVLASSEPIEGREIHVLIHEVVTLG